MEHLLRNNLLTSSQHGFIPNKSCCTNLLEYFETVTSVIDQGDPFDVIFLDFAEAFDKVPMERLLEKLRAHGVNGKRLAWIRSWGRPLQINWNRLWLDPVLRIRIRIRLIHMILGLLDPDLLVRGMGPDPSIIRKKQYCFVTSF